MDSVKLQDTVIIQKSISFSVVKVGVQKEIRKEKLGKSFTIAPKRIKYWVGGGRIEWRQSEDADFQLHGNWILRI